MAQADSKKIMDSMDVSVATDNDDDDHITEPAYDIYITVQSKSIIDVMLNCDCLTRLKKRKLNENDAVSTANVEVNSIKDDNSNSAQTLSPGRKRSRDEMERRSVSADASGIFSMYAIRKILKADQTLDEFVKNLSGSHTFIRRQLPYSIGHCSFTFSTANQSRRSSSDRKSNS